MDIVRDLKPSISISELDTVYLPPPSAQLEAELFGSTYWPVGPIIGSGLLAELAIIPDPSPADAYGESTSPRDDDRCVTPREGVEGVVDSASK